MVKKERIRPQQCPSGTGRCTPGLDGTLAAGTSLRAKCGIKGVVDARDRA